MILDEPAAGLDLAGRELLLAALADIARHAPGADDGHASATTSRSCPAATTHLLLLREGRVVAAGPVAEVATAELLSACFGIELDVERVRRPHLRLRGRAAPPAAA